VYVDHDGRSRRTAKVWKNFSLAYDLKGHEYSVWAVLALDEDQYLTGELLSILVSRGPILNDL
jgi:phospholipase A-2-activating protein